MSDVSRSTGIDCVSGLGSLLRSVLADYAKLEGWAAVVRVLDTMIRVIAKPRDKLVLRDLRAQAWLSWAAASPGARCEVVRRSHGSDPEHPAVRLLAARSASWNCAASGPARP